MIRRPCYGWAVLALLAVEIVIALFVRDAFVRPYLGDTLAVLLVHCFFRTVTPLRPLPAALASMAVATAVELGQLVGILGWLGLADNRIASTLLGTNFAAEDFVAYGTGALLALAIEWVIGRRMNLAESRTLGG